MLSLTCAISEYEHVRDLETRRVRPESIELNFIGLPVEEVFFRSLRFGEFDVSEMSMGRYSALVDAGDCPFVAIPVFPSRVFRHSSIYVRGDSDLRSPKQLTGARIGIPEWAQTAGIYVRGMLATEFDLHPNDVNWIQAGIDEPGREEEVRLRLPDGIRIERVADRTLSEMLRAGYLDAIISAHPPSGFKRSDGSVRTLFEDCDELERRYWKETKIFPIMHAIVLKKETFERNRWIAMNLLNAFHEAKNRSLARAKELTASRFPFPLSGSFVKDVVTQFGEDFWPYGVEKNRKTLTEFLGYAHAQGVTSRRLAIEDLFPAEVLASFKI